MMQTMQVRPVHNVPNARAHLGSSEYQKCVAHDPHPPRGTPRRMAIRSAATWSSASPASTRRDGVQRLKMLLASVGCARRPR